MAALFGSHSRMQFKALSNGKPPWNDTTNLSQKSSKERGKQSRKQNNTKPYSITIKCTDRKSCWFRETDSQAHGTQTHTERESKEPVKPLSKAKPFPWIELNLISINVETDDKHIYNFSACNSKCWACSDSVPRNKSAQTFWQFNRIVSKMRQNEWFLCLKNQCWSFLLGFFSVQSCTVNVRIRMLDKKVHFALAGFEFRGWK